MATETLLQLVSFKKMTVSLHCEDVYFFQPLYRLAHVRVSRHFFSGATSPSDMSPTLNFVRICVLTGTFREDMLTNLRNVVLSDAQSSVFSDAGHIRYAASHALDLNEFGW